MLELSAIVIHFIVTPQAAAAEIPSLLQGQAPAASSRRSSDNIGSKDYSKTIAAVVLGSGYEDDEVKMMRDACGTSSNKVPWLRPDMSKPRPPLWLGYGKHMVGRVKACLVELERDGKMKEDGIVLY